MRAVNKKYHVVECSVNGTDSVSRSGDYYNITLIRMSMCPEVLEPSHLAGHLTFGVIVLFLFNQFLPVVHLTAGV